ncbi:DUF3231 family protein [Neobacillus vireti]|uniref:DUF3231 family protein n=1 Tax=Neobacillus vireti LMG 21834 TaxID=1131730 RepID=A0AB94IGA7_9BACI|nr:DUF3231 family protein [Neobacillus vireti]ETI66145.1 hypothetical protein BAVI_24148 [Neobacillus vireti LMG 21834]KLT20081.1 hypothetical protein AA980_00150 [Neobacillus vireti]
METEQQPKLTASELSLLWTSYQNDSMAVCGITHFLTHIEDDSIREVLEFALDLSKGHIQKVSQIFEAEQYPRPQGFTERDVNLAAPRLFSDVLYLYYIENMGKFGLTAYSIALSSSSRDDMVDFYSTAMAETVELHNRSKRLLKEKGLYHRDSGLPTPDQSDFVKKQSFLTGFFGDRRPLLGVEISNLWYDSVRNGVGQAIIQGFSQVAKDKEVRQYFARGREISGKHLDLFGSKMHEDYLARGAFTLTGEVTDSKVSPFSDKLMIYHISALCAAGIGQYGISMASSPRHDLGIMYARLTAEVYNYVNDGAKIMINHGWMEQPPEAADRKKLTK